MLNTMTVTKTLGALCGALLVFLLGSWAASSLYRTGGHGEGEQAYAIAVAADEPAAEAAPAEVPFAEVFAAADAGAGERVWNNCRACHQLVEGANAVGPYLFGVVGRTQGAVAGYGYSDAVASLGGVWTPAELNQFLTAPGAYAPGTKMTFAGISDIGDRADLIAYLTTFGGSVEEGAAEVPAARPEAAADAAEETAAVAEAAAATPAVAEEPAAEEPAAEEPAAEEPDAAEPAPAPAAPEPPAGFDLAAGEAAFRVCAACHSTEAGRNVVGPYLAGVFGRDIASAEGFSYSGALAGLDGVWDAEKLDAFLTAPMAYAPGTKMGFPGVRDATVRTNLIGYLSTLGN